LIGPRVSMMRASAASAEWKAWARLTMSRERVRPSRTADRIPAWLHPRPGRNGRPGNSVAGGRTCNRALGGPPRPRHRTSSIADEPLDADQRAVPVDVADTKIVNLDSHVATPVAE